MAAIRRRLDADLTWESKQWIVENMVERIEVFPTTTEGARPRLNVVPYFPDAGGSSDTLLNFVVTLYTQVAADRRVIGVIERKTKPL